MVYCSVMKIERHFTSMFLCTGVQLYNERFILPVCICVLVYSSTTKGLFYQYVFVYMLVYRCTDYNWKSVLPVFFVCVCVCVYILIYSSTTKGLFYQYSSTTRGLFYQYVFVYWYTALQLKVYFTNIFSCTGNWYAALQLEQVTGPTEKGSSY